MRLVSHDLRNSQWLREQSHWLRSNNEMPGTNRTRHFLTFDIQKPDLKYCKPENPDVVLERTELQKKKRIKSPTSAFMSFVFNCCSWAALRICSTSRRSAESSYGLEEGTGAFRISQYLRFFFKFLAVLSLAVYAIVYKPHIHRRCCCCFVVVAVVVVFRMGDSRLKDTFPSYFRQRALHLLWGAHVERDQINSYWECWLKGNAGHQSSF